MLAATHEMKVLRHRIFASHAQRLATQHAPHGQQAAAPRTEAGDRNACIIGATGVKSAAGAKQGAEPPLVQTEQPQYQSGKDVHGTEAACAM